MRAVNFWSGRQMKHALALLAVLSLGGCLPNQAKDVVDCQTEASRFYQTYHAVDVSDPSSQYIIACMDSKGYDFTVLPADCDSHHPLPTQAACYTPSNWLAADIDQLGRILKY
jgi:hypothetical protein